MAIVIDKEFKELCDPLSPEEYAGLEQSIVEEGCRDCLVVWPEKPGKEILVDGHHRYEICEKYNAAYFTKPHHFSTRQEAINWIIDNQLSRRNITPERRMYYIGKRYENEKKPEGRPNKLPQSEDVISGRTGKKISKETGVSKATVERAAQYSKAVDTIAHNNGNETKQAILNGEIKATQAEVKQLAEKTPEVQKAVIEQVKNGEAKTIKEAEFRLEYTNSTKPESKKKSTFNLTNDNIEWAKWSWNPVTGCLHNCEYCYARKINARFSNDGFKPTFHADRLDAPFNTKIPGNIDTKKEPGYLNVFVCSMADLFGDWVPGKWISDVLNVVEKSPRWQFLFLTKNPIELMRYDFPKNAWVGTTVDSQERVKVAVQAFKEIKASVKFLSCEPLLGPVDFGPHLSLFDWIIIGGKSVDGKQPEQPKWEWVESLLSQARVAQRKVYFKPNLTIRPKEYPTH